MTDAQRSIEIAAPLARVWEVIADVEAWPRWTASMREIRRLDAGPFGVGSRARVKQPGLPTLVWEVTALDPGSRFVWAARSAGVLTTGSHVVTGSGDGSRLTLSIDWAGPFAGLVRALTGRRTGRFLEQETTGAKAFAEAGVGAG